ncbi:hypothetical protein J6590_090435 [Homalodisca vitripennis]|nr:hypothetical protein J6590_090435 [Homalodisca vitripennis]
MCDKEAESNSGSAGKRWNQQLQSQLHQHCLWTALLSSTRECSCILHFCDTPVTNFDCF